MVPLSVFVLAAAHLQDIVPLLAPLSLGGFWLVSLRWVSLDRAMTRAPEIAAILLLGVLIAVSVAINGILQEWTVIEFFRGPGRSAYMIGVFVVGFSLSPRWGKERLVLQISITVAALAGALSLVSYFVTPVNIGGVALSGERLLGTLGGHNPMAGAMGVMLVALWVLRRSPALTRGGRFFGRLAPWLIGVPIAFAMLMTKSRGFIIAWVLTAVIVAGHELWKRYWAHRLGLRSWRFAAVIVGVVAASAVVLAPRLENLRHDPNVTIRVLLAERAWQFFRQSPLIGVGVGTFEQSNVQLEPLVPGVLAVRTRGVVLDRKIQHDVEGGLHTHDLVLQSLVDFGLLGTLALILIFAAPLRRSARFRRAPGGISDPERRLIREFVLHSTLYLVIAGAAGGFTLISPGTAWLTWFMLARLSRISLRGEGSSGWRAGGHESDPYRQLEPLSV